MEHQNLSFARGAQLVQYVLVSIHCYWSQIFLIPSAVLKKVNNVCRMFLWSCRDSDDKTSYLKWSKVCSPKKHGGLGFRDITIWNKTAIGKLVWHIGAKKMIYGLNGCIPYTSKTRIGGIFRPQHSQVGWLSICAR